MASLIAVTAPADPRLADYVALTDVHLRRSLESAHGLFIAEGELVIRRAVSAGYRMRSLLITKDNLAGLAELGEIAQAPVYVVSAEVAEAITGYRVHRGALASMHRRPIPPPAEVLGQARRIVVLEDLVDHENVGAIFRCAAGLGFDAAVLAPRCADPLYRRAVKVSTGAVFALPYARMPDWRGGLGELRAAGFRLLALTPAAGATPIAQAGATGKLALMLGTEGGGLSRHWLDAADERVGIPMAAGVDSLNVAPPLLSPVTCWGRPEAEGRISMRGRCEPRHRERCRAPAWWQGGGRLARTRQRQPICNLKSDIVSSDRLAEPDDRPDGRRTQTCHHGQQGQARAAAGAPAGSVPPNWSRSPLPSPQCA